MDRRVDVAGAVLLAIAGAWLVWQAQQIRVGAVMDPLGPRAVPTALGVFFIVAAVAVAVRRIVLWQATEGPNLVKAEGKVDEPGHPVSAMRPLVLFAVALGYLATMPYIGYLIATPVFLVVGLWMMRVRRVFRVAVATVTYTAGTYLLFDRFLGITLPPSPFGI